jgi:hypothetical protein
MRTILILFLGLGVIASRTFADEKLPVLKVGQHTYSHVTVTKVTATDVFFISDQGMANAKLKNLEPAMQKHFHYDPAAAAAAERKLKLGSSPYHFRVGGTTKPATKADIKVELADAITKVEVIVNQPVTRLPRTPDMAVATYRPGWFHPGATTPEFNTVDVRATQELNYAKNEYVTSDLNPNVVYLGSELEFNSMTKFFYTDRSVPKKKLTGEEMVEINRLYRIIGQDRDRLGK